MRRILLLAILCPVAAPQEAPSAPIFFRKPDLETARRIDDLMSHNGIGSGTREARTKARAALHRIGAWTVPYLCDALISRKRVKTGRVAMNSALTLGRILDPHCLDALRTVASTDRGKKVVQVRKTACLVLGLFGSDEGRNVEALLRVLDERGARDEHHRAAAIALAKIDDKAATSALVAATIPKLPDKDPFYAAAVLLAASIRSQDAEPEQFLTHKEEVVRRVAATCLLIRPLKRGNKRLLTGRINSRAKDRKVRPLLYLALARIPGSDVRDDLLRCATRTDERDEARVAALIGLSYRWNMRESYKALHRALPHRRNDRVAAAMLFALAQTGAPDAVDDLMRMLRTGSPRSRFYAAGSLLYLVSLSNPDARHPRENGIREALANANMRSDPDAYMRDLDGMRQDLFYVSDLQKRAERAREGFRKIRDPYGLHLWDWSETDRAWALVNGLLPTVFDLDDVADKSDIDNPDKVGKPLPGVGGPVKAARASPEGSPEEQDLIDFLAEKPYFGPEDLGER